MASYQEYLQQISKDYEPTRAAIQNQINAIPEQQRIALADINAQFANRQGELDRQRDSFNYGANNQMNNRGLAWSNIGQNYASSNNRNVYAPAVANLQQNQRQDLNRATETYQNRRFDLENYLNSLIDEQAKQARAMWNEEQNRAAAQRAAAAQAAAMGNYLSAGAGQQASGGGWVMRPKNNVDGTKGYEFFDPSGKPVSATTFAAGKGVNLQNLLSDMGKAGDKFAGEAAWMLGQIAPLGGNLSDTEYGNQFRSLWW